MFKIQQKFFLCVYFLAIQCIVNHLQEKWMVFFALLLCPIRTVSFVTGILSTIPGNSLEMLIMNSIVNVWSMAIGEILVAMIYSSLLFSWMDVFQVQMFTPRKFHILNSAIVLFVIPTLIPYTIQQDRDVNYSLPIVTCAVMLIGFSVTGIIVGSLVIKNLSSWGHKPYHVEFTKKGLRTLAIGVGFVLKCILILVLVFNLYSSKLEFNILEIIFYWTFEFVPLVASFQVFKLTINSAKFSSSSSNTETSDNTLIEDENPEDHS
eukprot:TRINITY_DN1252_c0_g1_i1.p1 TRINITY_DN1252_c0_g1~~TRINITY_DN1252_c0_g1_i1.p1  ORF type:complete len:264 (+),score=8.65 TRINITY_DN1252_c0_g1_i1:662-1453(+)